MSDMGATGISIVCTESTISTQLIGSSRKYQPKTQSFLPCIDFYRRWRRWKSFKWSEMHLTYPLNPMHNECLKILWLWRIEDSFPDEEGIGMKSSDRIVGSFFF